jgi:FkbM family methyltransferase
MLSRLGDLLATACRPLPYFRGRQRLLDAVVARSGLRNATIHGTRMALPLSDVIGRNVYMGSYEPEASALVQTRLGPGSTFVDVGANIGYFTALASQAVGATGRVVAVEPLPALFSQLHATFRSAPNVVCLQTAIGEAAGTLDLYVPPSSAGNLDPSAFEYTSGMERVSVPRLSLESLFDQQSIRTADLLKIDVEGYEPWVIRGARRLLEQRRIKAILCELNPRLLNLAGSSPRSLAAQFIDAGYQPTSSYSDDAISNVLFVA